LASVAAQTLSADQFEVIVVDNGSTDDTEAVCATWQRRLSRFRYITERHPGLHAARHTGLRAAQSEILVYTDDDVRALPTWLHGILESFEDHQVGIVGGNNLPDFQADPPTWWDLLKDRTPWGWAVPALSVLDFGSKRSVVSPSFIWGCNLALRKNLLVEVGGFHPDGMPAEASHKRGDGESYVTREIVRRGYRAVFEPKASVHHLVASSRHTLSYLEQRGFAEGVSRVYTEIRRRSGLGPMTLTFLAAVHLRASARAMLERNSHPRASLLKGYASGIKQHTNRCAKDPELVRWIKQSNYLE
jgi:glycosyltransferase involved in cell wall biosynthesis